MKRFKKILALAIAMAMVLTMMSISAFAEGEPTGSITIKPSTTVTLANKSFKAYKILDATYSGTGESQAVSYTVPSTMKSWYDEYFSTGTGEAKKTATELAAAAGKTFDLYIVDQIAALSTAQLKDFEYAALAEAKDKGVEGVAGEASGANYKISELSAGYYVVEDEGTGVPISALMLDTVTDADVEIELKASDETEKEIVTAGELVNQKANELGIGRDVEYKITQKIPDTTGYTYYYYIINDTLSEGLTFKPETLVVKVGGQTLVKDRDYYLYADAETDAAVLNGKTFIVAFNDIVANIADANLSSFVIGAPVEITYSATVNSSAVTGVNPNTNSVNVQFSNNPDKDQRGDKDNYPGIPKNDTDTPTGVGPNKITDTYTTKIKVIKQDGTTKEKLNGVSFNLTGKCKDVVLEAEEVYELDPEGEYWMLKDGTYTKTAPQEEATVEELPNGSTGGWVIYDTAEDLSAVDQSVIDAIRTVGETQYRPYVAEIDGDKTVYQIIEPNDDLYESTTNKYKVVTHETSVKEYTLTQNGTTAKVGSEDGVAEFAQLGAGSYTLTETGGLPGYNGIAPITFDIGVTLPEYLENGKLKQFTGEETATWSVSNQKNGTVVYDATSGTFTITIDNNKGTVLPSTGGIGTTIFYVVGAILVIGAGVVMITRRRMDA